MADLTVNNGLTAEIDRLALIASLRAAHTFYMDAAVKDEADYAVKIDEGIAQYGKEMAAKMEVWKAAREKFVKPLIDSYRILKSSKGMLWWRKDIYRQPTPAERQTYREIVEASYRKTHPSPDMAPTYAGYGYVTRQENYVVRMHRLKETYVSKIRAKASRCLTLIEAVENEDLVNIRVAEADLLLINGAKTSSPQNPTGQV